MLLSAIPDAVVIVNRNGTIVQANDMVEKMFGVEREAILGQTVEVLIPEQFRAAHLEHRHNYNAAPVARTMGAGHDLMARRKTGETFPVEVSLCPVEVASQPLTICFIRDISTRKQVDTQLRKAEAKYRTAVERMPAVTFVAALDGDANELYVSPQIESLLGFTQAEWLGDPVLWYRQLHPDDRERWHIEFSKTCAFGEAFRSEYRFIARDGRTVWVHGEATMVRDKQGAPSFLQGFAYDITERKQAEQVMRRSHEELENLVRERTAERHKLEEQLRQSQKIEAIGRLAGGVAHDFNNLLTVIIGHAELLLTDLPDSDPRRDQLAAILSAGERAAGLTAQLLAFSRKAIIEPKVLDLNRVAESAVQMLRRIIGEDVRLVTHLARDVGKVKIDPGQLDQLLMNLAVNARDAMPRGGLLTIATANVLVPAGPAADPVGCLPGHYVQLTVSDTGEGMSQDVREQIFEPFFTTKRLGQGTGLGLATVYGIVSQAGGSISVESEVGQGTSFQILLPAVHEPGDVSDAELPRVTPRGKETILLAEDEEGVRRLARLALEMQGYTVLEADCGEAAVRVAASHRGPIRLLATDVVMPDFGGRQLADKIRATRPGVAVVYMSGYMDDAVVRHGIEAATDAFLQKPFTPVSLVRKVREVIDALPRPPG